MHRITYEGRLRFGRSGPACAARCVFCRWFLVAALDRWEAMAQKVPRSMWNDAARRGSPAVGRLYRVLLPRRWGPMRRSSPRIRHSSTPHDYGRYDLDMESLKARRRFSWPTGLKMDPPHDCAWNPSMGGLSSVELSEDHCWACLIATSRTRSSDLSSRIVGHHSDVRVIERWSRRSKGDGAQELSSPAAGFVAAGASNRR
jgi:hypothetical protein